VDGQRTSGVSIRGSKSSHIFCFKISCIVLRCLMTCNRGTRGLTLCFQIFITPAILFVFRLQYVLQPTISHISGLSEEVIGSCLVLYSISAPLCPYMRLFGAIPLHITTIHSCGAPATCCLPLCTNAFIDLVHKRLLCGDKQRVASKCCTYIIFDTKCGTTMS
jgi:hypothetical protein